MATTTSSSSSSPAVALKPFELDLTLPARSLSDDDKALKAALLKLTDAHARLNARIKAAEAEQEKVIDEIKAILDDRGASGAQLGKAHVVYAVQVSNKFDSAAFRKDHGQLYDAYKRPVESRPFRIY